MSDPIRLYSASEIAEALGVTSPTIWRWRKAGLLPRGYEAPRVGWMVDAAQLEQIKRWAAAGGGPAIGRPRSS